MMRKRSYKVPLYQGGFTLIELLVVISIIALLMAILMPVLYKAKEQARAAVCMGSLKQWGLIWSLYTSDYDGFFPCELSGLYHREWWIGALGQAGKTWQKHADMLVCPSARRLKAGGPFSDHGGPNHAYNFVWKSGFGPKPPDWKDMGSYALNLWFYNTDKNLMYGPPEVFWKNKQNVRLPTQVPLMLDSMWYGTAPHWHDEPAGGLAFPGNNPNGSGIRRPEYHGQPSPETGLSNQCEMLHIAMDRHHGGVNCVFADGHVGYVGIKRLWALRWHRKFPVNEWENHPNFWPDWMRRYPNP